MAELLQTRGGASAVDPLIGLDQAKKWSKIQFNQGADSGVRVCDANSLCSYWNEEEPSIAEGSKVCVLPQFLSDEEIAHCFDAEATACAMRKGGVKHDAVLSGAMGAPAIDEISEKPFEPTHTVLYLHRGGLSMANLPAALAAKLTHGLRELAPDAWSPAGAVPLAVRCVELHTYSCGGGLLTPGHCDNGSTLTLSVLLSCPHMVDGGRFVTWAGGEPVVHELARGDALLFRSEKSHNVSTVTRGTRRSLVVEMWRGSANTKDRFG